MPPKQAVVVGICGPSCSGKTTLATSLRSNSSGCVVISQDDFYNVCFGWLLFTCHQQEGFEKVDNYDNWDVPSAINFQSLIKTVKGWNYLLQHWQDQEAKTSHFNPALVIVEGFLLFSNKELQEEFDLSFFLQISRETCLQRRLAKDEWLRDNMVYFGKHSSLPPGNSNSSLMLSVTDQTLTTTNRYVRVACLLGTYPASQRYTRDSRHKCGRKQGECFWSCSKYNKEIRVIVIHLRVTTLHNFGSC